MQCS